jgi:high-affinity iron transporter
MLAAAIVVFREVIEAGLIVGIVLAVTRNIPRSGLWVSGGVAAGILGSCLVAAFTGAIGSAFSGAGQELFDAAILATAVVMLAWHNIWMARHGREMAAELKAAGEAVSSGAKSLAALSLVVGVAVLREGAEVVLFLYGILLADSSSWGMLIFGGVLGLGFGVLVSMLTYFGLVKIPTKRLFAVTSGMIAFLAAGMAAQSVAFLEQAGMVTVLGDTVWDTSSILSDKSILGRVLHTLIGYNDQPSILQLLVYLATVVTIFLLMRIFGSARPRERGNGPIRKAPLGVKY